MSIADELRDYTEEQIKWLDMTKVHYRKLLAIASRIDAEHEAKVSYWQGASYKDGYDEGFASAKDWLAQNEDAMAKHGWVRLPKDADDRYIQPSDIPHLTKANDGKRLAFYPSLELLQDGTWRFAGWTLDRYRISKPTVEDVLREFAMEVMAAGRADDHEVSDAIDFYAPKLRLKEDE